MLLGVAVIFCLKDQPGRCREEVFDAGDQVSTPFACFQGAQIEQAQWLEAHPKWMVSRWTCRRARSVAKL